MTKRLVFTQASISRAVKAARANGLTVAGINMATGDVLVHDGPAPLAYQNKLEQTPPASKWEDVQA